MFEAHGAPSSSQGSSARAQDEMAAPVQHHAGGTVRQRDQQAIAVPAKRGMTALDALDAGELSPGRKLRSRDRPMAVPRGAPLPSSSGDRDSTGSGRKDLGSTPSSSVWRGKQGVDLVLRAVLEELVLDELADATVEELENNKWNKEKLTGWLRHGVTAELSNSALRTMIAECGQRDVAASGHHKCHTLSQYAKRFCTE